MKSEHYLSHWAEMKAESLSQETCVKMRAVDGSSLICDERKGMGVLGNVILGSSILGKFQTKVIVNRSRFIGRITQMQVLVNGWGIIRIMLKFGAFMQKSSGCVENRKLFLITAVVLRAKSTFFTRAGLFFHMRKWLTDVEMFPSIFSNIVVENCTYRMLH